MASKTKDAVSAPAPAPAKKMMFPKQAAAQAAQEARQQASGERPPPTTDSWDNEPVVVSEWCGVVWPDVAGGGFWGRGRGEEGVGI